MKYEYTTVRLGSRSLTTDLKTNLDSMAEKGWEYVDSISELMMGRTDTVHLIFRRPKQ